MSPVAAGPHTPPALVTHLPPMKSSPALWLSFLSLAALAGCAVPVPPGVTRFGDGVLQAGSPEEAERFCRTTGDPTRLLDPAGTPPPAVRFRCD